MRKIFKKIKGWVSSRWQIRTAPQHLRHLEYAYKRLSDDDSVYSMSIEDRCYKMDVVLWLADYYRTVVVGNPVEITPKQELARILRLKSKEAGPREHVFASVLFHWVKHRRIDGY